MYATGRTGQRRVLHIINSCRRSGGDGSLTGGSDTAEGSNEKCIAPQRRLNQRSIYSSAVAARGIDEANASHTGLCSHSLLAQIMLTQSLSHTQTNVTAVAFPTCLLQPARKNALGGEKLQILRNTWLSEIGLNQDINQ